MNEANQNDCLVTGQRVHWTEMTARRGNSMKFSRREGKVASYNPGDPIVVVRYRGTDITKLRTQLRVEGQKSELTELVEEMAG